MEVHLQVERGAWPAAAASRASAAPWRLGAPWDSIQHAKRYAEPGVDNNPMKQLGRP